MNRVRAIGNIRNLAALVVAAVLLATFPVNPASAADWATNVTWSKLHVKQQEGVFEKFRREYVNGVLQADSATQHDYAWVRTDEESVTVQFRGGVGNAGKQIQFVPDAPLGTPFIDDVAGDENIVVANGDGLAEYTITVDQPQAGDTVTVGLKAGSTEVGPIILQWQEAGYGPIVKLVGTPSGRQATCLVNPGYVGFIASNAAHSCLQNDLEEVTWKWSVFSRDWVTDYAQTFTKSYLAGDTIALNYRVTDIWGTVLVGKEVKLDVDPKCAVCKWGSFDDSKPTNAQGIVSFSVPNKNTAAQVKVYKSVNPDTKEQGIGTLAFAITPTTNDISENVDYYWPQIVSNLTLKTTSAEFTITKRGPNAADPTTGNVVVGGVTNPAMPTDPLGIDQRDLILARYNIIYMKNTDTPKTNFLYAPKITVSADNGGRVAKVEPTADAADLIDVSQMASSISFNYVYSYDDPAAQDGIQLAFAGTKPGVTTFTVQIGTMKKTFTQTFTAEASAARYVVPVVADTTGVTKANQAVKFRVVDRFGNGVAGIGVDVASSGAGTLVAPLTRVTSDVNGFVSVTANSTVAGVQTLTATAVDESVAYQFAFPGIPEWGLSAGSPVGSATVTWGRVAIPTVAGGKGVVKVTVLNGSGKSLVVKQGTKKLATVKISKANIVLSVKLKKGSYKLAFVVGSVTKTVSFKVS